MECNVAERSTEKQLKGEMCSGHWIKMWREGQGQSILYPQRLGHGSIGSQAINFTIRHVENIVQAKGLF